MSKLKINLNLNFRIVFELIGIIIGVITMIALFIQNYYISIQTKELKNQTYDIQQGIKQDREFNRLEFIYKNTDNMLGAENNETLDKIKKNQKFTDKQKLISWVNNFEVLADLYYDKKLIKLGELNIYFGKTYINATCNHFEVINFIKNSGGHNGLKSFCYCLFPEGVNNKEVYKTDCTNNK